MKTTTVTVLTAAACVSGAGADIFQTSMIDHGLTTGQHNIGGVTLDIESLGGQFVSKTVGGAAMTGISGGHVSGEIDATESMRFVFGDAMRVSSLELGALFVDGQHGDRVNERAFVTVNDAMTFELALTSEKTASWDGLGSVVNLSHGVEGHAGIFAVKGDDIFGVGVTSMELWAPQEDAPGSRGSDYGFVSMTTAPVPTPGAVALMGLGGLLVVKRRRG